MPSAKWEGRTGLRHLALRTWHLAIAGLVFLILGAAAAAPRLAAGRERARQSACGANVRQLAMAMLMYAADYDDRFPPVERWTRLVDPYSRVPVVFTCPARPGLERGYAMNRDLSLAARRDVASPGATALLFEAAPAAAGALPPVAYRHPRGAWFAYADGHTALLGP